ncbi:MAG: FAD-dependent oxidoreductase [Candidatus Omnitrophica bacterium]|nr:FAD-dependent oxidoreductase [Candidatus Omnitrophota bacterium]
MPKLVIIGQSPAAYSALRTICTSADWSVALIATDTCLPYDRALFPGLITRQSKEKDVFFANEGFYKEHKVELILDKELSRINFSRRKIYLAERLQVEYDALLLTDTPQLRLPEIKGIRRPGVFDIARLDSLHRLLKHLIFIETAVVVPTTRRGLDIALALKAAGKEVVLVASGDLELSRALFAEFGGLIAEHGLRVVDDNTVEDILGEGDVKAVRFKTGKVMACETVIFEEALPDLRFLAGTDLLIRERICVHVNMLTNIPDVYAADAVMELPVPSGEGMLPLVGTYSLDTGTSLRQGECAARAILGQTDSVQENISGGNEL